MLSEDRVSEQHTWQERLRAVYDTMREMSLQTNPQAMVRAYARRMDALFPVDRRISLSRRELQWPQFRITRFSGWREEINPWKQRDRLPVLEGGILAELIYSDQPHFLDDIDVAPTDPAFPYLEGQHSLLAIPMLDHGMAMNMVILTRSERRAFDRERFPDNVWLSNLFGRATHNLVLKEEVEEAYEAVDREMRVVAEIQHSLLPTVVPQIPTLELATSYETAERAGGDYYDFFPWPDGRWGLLIADVSGHGTPAAVLMAITHAIAHLVPPSVRTASEFLAFLNRQIAQYYTADNSAFVTAFFGLYDPVGRQLEFSSAGHNPPLRWNQCSQKAERLREAVGLPLGVLGEAAYPQATVQLTACDCLVLYTDGITEAPNVHDELFGAARLEQLVQACGQAAPQAIVDRIVATVREFGGSRTLADDRTLVVARIS